MPERPWEDLDFEEHVEGRVVRIAEISERPPIVRSTLYVDCDIHGPAVIAPLGRGGFQECELEGSIDEIFIPAEAGRRYYGVVGLENVGFFRCRLHDIGVLALPQLIERFRTQLSRPNEAPERS